jgi:hypothetical protein
MPAKKNKKKTSVKVRDLKPSKNVKGGYEKLGPPGVRPPSTQTKIQFGS